MAGWEAMGAEGKPVVVTRSAAARLAEARAVEATVAPMGPVAEAAEMVAEAMAEATAEVATVAEARVEAATAGETVAARAAEV